MKKFFFKLKKLLNPTTAVCAAAGLVTIVLYLLFGNPSTKGESALFLIILFSPVTMISLIGAYGAMNEKMMKRLNNLNGGGQA